MDKANAPRLALLLLAALLATLGASFLGTGKTRDAALPEGDREEARIPDPPQADPKPRQKILFLGDSLTYRNDWQAAFPEADIQNAGVDGDTTAQVLARLDEALEGQPDTIVLMIGINDLLQGKGSWRVAQNIGKILGTIRTARPDVRIVLESILPISDSLADRKGLTSQTLADLNGRLADLAGEYDAAWTDLWPILGPEGTLPPEHTLDGLHLSPAAYRLLEEALRKIL